MNIKDLSVAGKMWRASGMPGRNILAGLSRRRGGRWSGSLVYCFWVTPGKVFGDSIPGRKTVMVTLAMTFSHDISLLILVSLFGQVGM